MTRAEAMKFDDIISYSDIVSEEGQNIQKGMNFKTRFGYSILLMSVRRNAPYADQLDANTGLIVYEGHDVQRNSSPQPSRSSSGYYNMRTKSKSMKSWMKVYGLTKVISISWMRELFSVS